MYCPHCKEPMIILEYEEVEIDYCLSCEGIWLDAGELELLFDDEKAYQELMHTGEVLKKTKEKKVKCPVCRKKMEKIRIGTEEKVILDRCVYGDGIWLDKGELDDVIRLGLPHREGSLIQAFLGDVFQGSKRETPPEET